VAVMHTPAFAAARVFAVNAPATWSARKAGVRSERTSTLAVDE
jgi:hypothetical protein